jgi:hypothetical protein
MKRIHVLISLLIASSNAVSQNSLENNWIAKNTIYIEVFGHGFGWSVNYDRLIAARGPIMGSFNAGITYIPSVLQFGSGEDYYGVNGGYNWMLGRKNHHFEFGAGLNFMLVRSLSQVQTNEFYKYFSPFLAYRYQRPQGGVFARLSIYTMLGAPIFYSSSAINNGFNMNFRYDLLGIGSPIFPWPGISLGYTFKDKKCR